MYIMLCRQIQKPVHFTTSSRRKERQNMPEPPYLSHWASTIANDTSTLSIFFPHSYTHGTTSTHTKLANKYVVQPITPHGKFNNYARYLGVRSL